MLNVVQKPLIGQDCAAFVREGFTTLSALNANVILRECAYDHQRKISKSHVEVLADIMRRGGWEPKDKLDFALIDGTLILVNGYHRMNAQVLSGKTLEWTVVIHPCMTMREVHNLYYKFDTNTRIRTGSQIVAGMGFADEHGLSATMAEKLFNAVPIIANNFSKAVKDRDTLTTRVVDRRIELAKAYVAAARQYEECLGRMPVKVGAKFRSAGVTAVALVTLRFQPMKAFDFWKGAAKNDGLRKGDPRLALYNDFLARSMNTGSAVQAISSPAYAWNAFFEDREIKIIKVYAERRVFIAGTPWER